MRADKRTGSEPDKAPNQPDSPGGGEQDPEKDGSDSTRERPEADPSKPDSPGGGQN